MMFGTLLRAQSKAELVSDELVDDVLEGVMHFRQTLQLFFQQLEVH